MEHLEARALVGNEAEAFFDHVAELGGVDAVAAELGERVLELARAFGVRWEEGGLLADFEFAIAGHEAQHDRSDLPNVGVGSEGEAVDRDAGAPVFERERFRGKVAGSAAGTDIGAWIEWVVLAEFERLSKVAKLGCRVVWKALGGGVEEDVTRLLGLG